MYRWPWEVWTPSTLAFPVKVLAPVDLFRGHIFRWSLESVFVCNLTLLRAAVLQSFMWTSCTVSVAVARWPLHGGIRTSGGWISSLTPGQQPWQRFGETWLEDGLSSNSLLIPSSWVHKEEQMSDKIHLEWFQVYIQSCFNMYNWCGCGLCTGSGLTLLPDQVLVPPLTTGDCNPTTFHSIPSRSHPHCQCLPYPRSNKGKVVECKTMKWSLSLSVS